MRILITGAAGFIGYHLANALLQQGHYVVGVDIMHNYYSTDLKAVRLNRLKNCPRYRHVYADIMDFGNMVAAVRIANPEVVYHLAGQAGVRHSIERPDAYVRCNVLGSTNILEALKKHGKPKHVIMASSSSVYGASTGTTSHEDDDTDHPLSVYAASKKAMELIAHSYAHQEKMPITIARFFTVWGPLGRPDMAMHRFIENITAGLAIEVTGDGKQKRDFTHVFDVATALEKLAPIPPNTYRIAGDTHSGEASPFRVLNISRHKPVAIIDMIHMVENVLGRQAKINYVPASPADAKDTYGHSEELTVLTGFRPGFNVIEGNIEHVVREGIDAGIFPPSAILERPPGHRGILAI